MRAIVGERVFLEGAPGQSYLRDAADINTLLEECWAVPTRSALLYADNLPPSFFDVSSQQAGTMLQKLPAPLVCSTPGRRRSHG